MLPISFNKYVKYNLKRFIYTIQLLITGNLSQITTIISYLSEQVKKTYLGDHNADVFTRVGHVDTIKYSK